MAKYLLVFFGLALLFCTSCISHKDVLYFQDNETVKDSIPQLIEQQKPYRIQINDILNIRIKVLDQDNVSIFNPIGDGVLGESTQENAYFNGFTVSLQGNITIPQLGDFKVLSLTTKEIEELIKERLLKEQFNEFASTVVTVRLAGLRYTTIGEIGTGQQTLFTERATIFEAIANAGDITEFGDRKDVLIIRQYPHGQEIHHIDLTNINVFQSKYYYILPNDMIYVKPLKQKTLGLGSNAFQTFTTLLGVVTVITSTILLINR
ncbi:polysaccharide biosynthesis/export family protein [Winogradskyella immobilis]|uniref:Polysaccharide biosynthesis/export family protein n=1 Tax=Winogradskyella immobilis TaxID=2816852 RepID=A0ABS8EP82_9FLAO|nr:polysaccharide biosynthesis/export family protein [Winogradskyella immobilis]MCC1484920.1 polysaccharide biosynthesis/export family protein [Winogradskyella immobilis]MCG0017012.1 polysaccharide biosynthesis/export family protein [Winogradskyella immobilis]